MNMNDSIKYKHYIHTLLFDNSFKTIYIFSLFGFFG